MTARTRSRHWFVGAAVAALLAPLALVVAVAAPAQATGQFHEVSIYKKEKHVDVSGDYPQKNMHEHVYCDDPDDYALDGMWRVDNVEQANPPETFGDERDVYFTASYNDPTDTSEWHFRAVNFADGTAQIKLFVVCIRDYTENQHLHEHGIRVSNQFADPRVGINTPTYDADHANVCPADAYAVSPGFQLTSHGPDFDAKIRLYRSWPTPDFRSWHWSFVVDEPSVDIRFTVRCLRFTTAAANGHAHQLPMTWRPNGYGGDFRTLVFNKTQEIRLNCDDAPNGAAFQLYKAAVGAFWINDPFHVWFMGMDPRPKQRSYKFWREPGGDDGVYLAALCIKSRTGKQIKPVP